MTFIINLNTTKDGSYLTWTGDTYINMNDINDYRITSEVKTNIMKSKSSENDEIIEFLLNLLENEHYGLREIACEKILEKWGKNYSKKEI